MKKFQLFLVILLTYLTFTQSISLSTNNAKSTTRTGGKAIDQNPLIINRTPDSESREVEVSAADLGPSDTTSNLGNASPIIFPETEETPRPVRKPKHIPLSVLKNFGLDKDSIDLQELFQNHVANVKVVQVKDEVFLADRNGSELRNSKNERVYLLRRPTEKVLLPDDGFASRAALGVTSSSGFIGSSRSHSLPKHFNSLSLSEQRKNLVRKAVCKPELKALRLPLKVAPNIIMIPQCVEVKQCGGCCFSERTECRPHTTEKKTFDVLMVEYAGDYVLKLDFVNETSVTVEEHVNCTCECKTRKEDCNQQQEYNESDCACVCRNDNDRQKCDEENGLKSWNDDSCNCACKHFLECSSNDYFDLNVCECRPVKETLENQ